MRRNPYMRRTHLKPNYGSNSHRNLGDPFQIWEGHASQATTHVNTPNLTKISKPEKNQRIQSDDMLSSSGSSVLQLLLPSCSGKSTHSHPPMDCCTPFHYRPQHATKSCQPRTQRVSALHAALRSILAWRMRRPPPLCFAANTPSS